MLQKFICYIKSLYIVYYIIIEGSSGVENAIENLKEYKKTKESSYGLEIYDYSLITSIYSRYDIYIDESLSYYQ